MGNSASGPSGAAETEQFKAPTGTIGSAENDWDYSMDSNNENVDVNKQTNRPTVKIGGVSWSGGLGNDTYDSNFTEGGMDSVSSPKSPFKPTKVTTRGDSTTQSKSMQTETEDSTSVIMEDSAAVFDFLENTKEEGSMIKGNKVPIRCGDNDEISVRDQPPAIFEVLESPTSNHEHYSAQGTANDTNFISPIYDWFTAQQSDRDNRQDDDQSDTDYSETLARLLGSGEGNDDDISISNRSTDIFKVLDATPVPDVEMNVQSVPMTIFSNPRRTRSRDSSAKSINISTQLKDAGLKERNIFRILSERDGHATPVILEETAEDEGRDDMEKDSRKSGVPGEIDKEVSDTASVDSGLTEAFHHDDKPDDSYVLVKEFDDVFDQFLRKYPKFMRKYPDLVQAERKARLQELVVHFGAVEKDLSKQLATLKGEKKVMETNFQWNLRQASRRKASSQIKLQSELATTEHRAKLREVDLLMRILNASEVSARKQFHYRQHQKAKKASFKGATGIANRDEVVDLIPDDDEGHTLKVAMFGPLQSGLTERGKMDEVRLLQVENAFTTSEMAVLKKKLAMEQMNLKKHSWIDSVLLRMDGATKAKLKQKYMAKIGLKTLPA